MEGGVGGWRCVCKGRVWYVVVGAWREGRWVVVGVWREGWWLVVGCVCAHILHMPSGQAVFPVPHRKFYH